MEKKKHVSKQHVAALPADEPPFVAEPEPTSVFWIPEDAEPSLVEPVSAEVVEPVPATPAFDFEEFVKSVEGPLNSAYWYEDNGATRLTVVKPATSETGEVTQLVFTASVYSSPAANQIVNMLDALFVP